MPVGGILQALIINPHQKMVAKDKHSFAAVINSVDTKDCAGLLDPEPRADWVLCHLTGSLC